MNKKFIFILIISVMALGGCAIGNQPQTRSANPAPRENPPAEIPAAPAATSSVESKAEPQLNVYTDNTYGFEISYPKNLVAENVFKQYYVLSDKWRAGGGELNGEKPLLAIPVFRTESDNSYPRYFAAEARIGVSSDPQDVKDCLKDNIYGAVKSLENINGINFVVYAIQDAAMMQYLGGKSYRVVHNNLCYAIEQLKAGSGYRDDPKSDKDISDATLADYFNQAGEIIKTFKFIK